MNSLNTCLTALCMLVVLTAASYAQSFNNVVVDNKSGNKSETSVAVDPKNAEHLMATWNDYTNGTFCKPGWAFSADGGDSWYTEGTITPSASDHYGLDPSCAIGTNGDEYYAYVASSGSGNYGPVEVSMSTNDGQNWSTHQASAYSSDHDKPYLAVDNTTSKYGGNIYVVYKSSYLHETQGATVDFMMIATLNAGGAVEHRLGLAEAYWNNSTYNNINFGVPAVGPHGTLYVAYYLGTGTTDGPADIKLMKSTTGGSTFTAIKTFSIAGAYQDYDGFLRVCSVPTIVVDPTNSNIYLAFVEHNTSGDHIYFSRSTDSGSNWSTPVMVTQLTTGDQVLPQLTVNSAGYISLVYYEYVGGDINVYSAQSFNSGQSFTGQAGTGEDVKLTSVPSNPSVDGGTAHGYLDYLGAASDGSGEVHAVWTDFRSNTSQDIYCANL